MANLHGYTIDEINLAQIELGKRRFEQYVKARIKMLRGHPVEADVNQANLPLRTANNRKWTQPARFVNYIRI